MHQDCQQTCTANCGADHSLATSRREDRLGLRVKRPARRGLAPNRDEARNAQGLPRRLDCIDPSLDGLAEGLLRSCRRLLRDDLPIAVLHQALLRHAALRLLLPAGKH